MKIFFKTRYFTPKWCATLQIPLLNHYSDAIHVRLCQRSATKSRLPSEIIWVLNYFGQKFTSEKNSPRQLKNCQCSQALNKRIPQKRLLKRVPKLKSSGQGGMSHLFRKNSQISSLFLTKTGRRKLLAKYCSTSLRRMVLCRLIQKH